jgi:hypothetical protein
VLLAVAQIGILGVFVYVWAGVDAHHEATTAVVVRDGLPVVLRARCGKPMPFDLVEVRVAPADGSEPTDRDPVVFKAAATGDGLAEVPLAPQVAGYTVSTYDPLQAGVRYYFTNTRFLSASGDGAPSFKLSDLRVETLLVLFPIPDNEQERRLALGTWPGSTSC